jgi:hypothetical protein
VKGTPLKARQLLALIIAITTLVVFGGSKFGEAASPRIASEIQRAAIPFLRKSGHATLRHKDDAALADDIARTLAPSNSIKSVDDLAAESGISLKEILESSKRRQSFRNKMTRELNRIVMDYAKDAGLAVAEAHCNGLKKKLKTGEPATISDYTVYFVVAVVKNKLPMPPQLETREAVKDLLVVGNHVYNLPLEDEAAYVKAACIS